ncbi:MAG: fibronectin type III domain-containing protein [Deltaproteobacteria bacterium]|nr:fibronectin type III domain-containing protein [Deltaproteobacteria bacterium]
MKPLTKRSTMKEQEYRSLFNTLILWGVIVLFLLISSVHSAMAKNVTLAWDPNDASENVTGYKVYYRTGSFTYENSTGAAEGNSPITVPVNSLSDPDAPQFTVSGLQDGAVYFFAVTAYNAGAESSYSNEVSDPSVVPVGVSISGTDSVLENSNASYTAMVMVNDGSTHNITEVATWSEDSPYASISGGGVLTTLNVSGSQTVTIQVNYTFNNITETAARQVTIVDQPASNVPPDKPSIAYPLDGQNETEVPLSITTDPFSDTDGDSHTKSRWQISEQNDFSSLVLDVATDSHRTTLPVPHMILKPNQTYYARVRFYDVYSAESEWSDSAEFTTSYYVIDTNGDGVPDEWEVDGTVDFNLNGIPDIYEPENIKCVRASDGSVNIGVEKISDSITEIQALDAVDPADIPYSSERPSDIIYGLFSYRLILNQPGAVARVRVYFSAGIYSTDNFYKYDTLDGWYNYTQHTTFNDDGQSFILELTDGGSGDSDGVANGIITDPGGISSGSSQSLSGDLGAGAGDSGRGGCFLATATYGSPLESHVSILKDFRDTYLVHCSFGRMIIRTYYKYSPDLALFIEKHEVLKSVVAVTLIPLIAFSYLSLHIGLVMALMILVVGLVLSTIVMAALFRRMARHA